MGAKHTPGPWSVIRGDDTTYILGNYTNCTWRGREGMWELARIRVDESEDIGRSKAEDKANARLIAAAPKMLEACVRARRGFSLLIAANDLTDDEREQIALLDEAIASATGA